LINVESQEKLLTGIKEAKGRIQVKTRFRRFAGPVFRNTKRTIMRKGKKKE